MSTQITTVSQPWTVAQSDPFAELFQLPHEAVLFVPSTFNVDQVDLALQSQVVNEVAQVLAKQFGGVTVESPAKGGWLSDQVGMVWEQVVPVKVYMPDLDQVAKQTLVNMARHIKTTMHQEAVLLVVDGKAMLA